MNSIPKKQNSPEQLRRLAAQRQLYSTAKTIFNWQVVLTGPIAILLAFAALLSVGIKPYAAAFGFTMSLCDILLITPWLKRLRSRAASIQEAFDCEVLSLPWNSLKGDRPSRELEKEQADKHAESSHSMPALTDWYPPAVGSLPLHIGRLICQRSNCWWDAKQRRIYSSVVVCFTIGIIVAMVVFGMAEKFALVDFFLKVLGPLSPALLLGVRQAAENFEAADRIDKLRSHCEQVWKSALDDVGAAEIDARSRSLQDEIFENRRRSPLVANLLFQRLRPKLEIQMNHGASELVAEARAKLNLK